MNNFFQQSKLKKIKELEELKELKQSRKNTMSLQNIERYLENDKNTELLEVMKKGTIPLKHPALHTFRDADPNAFYLKKHNPSLFYKPAKERAEDTLQKFKEGHLKEDVYNNNLPFKTDKYWLRVEDPKKQGMALRFGQNPRTENERVKQTVQVNSEKLDTTAKNMKMVQFPDWKPQEKQKWVSNQNFYTSSHPAQWEMVPYGNRELNNQYMEAIDILIRERVKEKEGDRGIYESTIRKDPQELQVTQSQSIRTYIQDKQLGNNDFNRYSKNRKLQHYGQGLVKTKSVDHLVPFIHGNNYKVRELKDLRPKDQRIFNKSALEQVVNIRLPTKESEVQQQQQKNKRSEDLDQKMKIKEEDDQNEEDDIRKQEQQEQDKNSSYVDKYYLLDDETANKIVNKYFIN